MTHEHLLLGQKTNNKQFVQKLIAKKNLSTHLQKDLPIQTTTSQHKI